MFWTLEDWARKHLFSRWPFGSHFPVPFILTGKNSGKRSPPVGKCSHVDAASSLLMSFFLSIPLPCSSSLACFMRLCQQVLDDPNEDHLYMGKRALAFCHPCSGSYASQSPGVLSIQPLRLVPPTLSCSSGLHTEGCTLDLKQEVERSSCWDFIWVSCSSVF